MNLSRCQNISNNSLIDITRFENLQHLNLSYLNSIEGNTIFDILKSCGKLLKFIDVSYGGKKDIYSSFILGLELNCEKIEHVSLGTEYCM